MCRGKPRNIKYRRKCLRQKKLSDQERNDHQYSCNITNISCYNTLQRRNHYCHVDTYQKEEEKKSRMKNRRTNRIYSVVIMSFCKVSCKNLKSLFRALACNAGLTQIAGAVLVPIFGPGIYSYLPFLAGCWCNDFEFCHSTW